MATKRRKKSLVQPGEPKQKTRKGLEIPVPERSRFFDELERTVKKSSEREKESR
jgi:hypothetical protein